MEVEPEGERRAFLPWLRERWLSLPSVILLCIAVGLAWGGTIAFLTPVLAIALLVALGAGLVMLSDARMGLYALIGVAALLPFAAVPLEVGFNPTFLDGVLVVLFAAWLAGLSAGRERRFFVSPLGWTVGVFVVLALFSFVAGLGHTGLNKNVVRHFAEVILSISLFFLVQNVVRELRDLEWATRVIILAGFAAALIGVVLYFLPQPLTVRLLSALRVVNYPSGWGVLRFVEDDPSLPMRATSTCIDPNVLGGLLILTTALTVPQLFARHGLLGRVWVALILATMLACLVLTFSRGSLVGLGVGLLFLATVRYRKLFLAGVVVVLMLILLPQTQSYVQHFREGLFIQDRATLMRLGEYRDALALISRHPWFGVGFSGSPSIELYIGVSNVYLLIAEEMGLIGLSVFLIAIAIFFLHTGAALKGLNEDGTLYAIFLGLEAAIVGTLVGGLFDHYFFNLDFPHSVALFWLYVGLGVTAARLTAERAASGEAEA